MYLCKTDFVCRENQNVDKRIVYLDYMRIFAMISVIMIHVSATRLNLLELGSYNWLIVCTFNKAMGYAVPLFVMISGAVSFGKDIIIKDLYQKRILKVAIAYVLWNVFYSASHNLARPFITGQEIDWYAFGNEIIEGRYHLWYCRMIIGIYILIPVLKYVIRDKIILKYTLVVLFVFSIMIPSVQSFFEWKWLDNIIRDVGIDNSKYIFFFLLGYYLSTVQMSSKCERIIIYLGICSEVIVTLCQVYIMANNAGWNKVAELGDILLVLISASLFLLFKKFKWKKNSQIKRISELCFGIYLVHDYFVGCIDSMGLTIVSFNPIIAVPVIVCLVFCMSLTTAYIGRKLPYIGKYIT